MRALVCLAICGMLCLAKSTRAAQTNQPVETAFTRIIHGWTNYSTAFSATHTLGSASDYSTVASFYTPGCDVRPVEYSVIVIWGGPVGTPVNFGNFDFQVFIWSSFTAFTNSPRQGDIATFNFPAPTGGSTTAPDAFTRGGRPAYELRFRLTNAPVTLTHHHAYLVGFAAMVATSGYEDLFVPTSSHRGQSDVQAGDILIGGWRYVADSGGSTIYDGQLAVALQVQPVAAPPSLFIRPGDGALQISWPASAACFSLEACGDLVPGAIWQPVDQPVELLNESCRVTLTADEGSRWFRLRK